MNKILLIFIFIVSAISVLAQGKTVIRISAENIIETDRITLDAIAQISGNSDKLPRLKKISLGFAPNVGMIRELNRERIKLAISAAGFTENDYSLLAPPKISVRRSVQNANQVLIRQTIEKEIIANFQKPAIDIKITKLTLPEKIELPKGNVEIRISNFSGISNLHAPFYVPLEIRVDDKVIKRMLVNVEIELLAEVLVVSKIFLINEKINQSDIRKEKIRLEKPLANYIMDIDTLHGKKLLKNLAVGSPLTVDAIIADMVIRTGDTIKIIGEADRMQIIIAGEARGSGSIGDRIAVKNSQSGAILQAIVVDEGLVKIKF